MPIKYAGINTLLPDEDGELAAFLERHLAVRDMNFWFPSVYEDAARIISPIERSNSESLILPIGRPNWPAPPSPALNTLYWPTGATRWGCMLLLVDEERKNDIVNSSNVSSGGTYQAAVQTLQLYWEGFELDIAMYALAPHPVSLPLSGDPTLWIVPLVDERYLWQWKTVGDISAQGITDWESLVDYCGNQCTAGGLSTLAAPSAFSWSPDIDELPTLNYVNAAVLLDASALSIGRRIVRKLDGQTHALAPADGQTAWDQSLVNARVPAYNDWFGIAGAVYSQASGSAGAPASVTVLFHRDMTTKVVSGSTVGATGVASGTTKLIRVPYTPEDNPPGTFDDTKQTNLANQISSDYYAWLSRQGDLVFAGLKPWDMSGFEDLLTIEMGSPGRSGHPWCGQTRVKSLPTNWGISSLLSSGEVLHPSSSPSSGIPACGCGARYAHGSVTDCIAGYEFANKYTFDVTINGATRTFTMQHSSGCTWSTTTHVEIGSCDDGYGGTNYHYANATLTVSSYAGGCSRTLLCATVNIVTDTNDCSATQDNIDETFVCENFDPLLVGGDSFKLNGPSTFTVGCICAAPPPFPTYQIADCLGLTPDYDIVAIVPEIWHIQKNGTASASGFLCCCNGGNVDISSAANDAIQGTMDRLLDVQNCVPGIDNCHFSGLGQGNTQMVVSDNGSCTFSAGSVVYDPISESGPGSNFTPPVFSIWITITRSGDSITGTVNICLGNVSINVFTNNPPQVFAIDKYSSGDTVCSLRRGSLYADAQQTLMTVINAKKATLDLSKIKFTIPETVFTHQAGNNFWFSACDGSYPGSVTVPALNIVPAPGS